MIYFKELENVINKYEVSVDQDELKILKEEIIEKCSYIRHKTVVGCVDPNYFRIKNGKVKNVETKTKYRIESRDSLQYEDYDEYEFEYDEYEYPYLVSIIDGLLADDGDEIDNLYFPKDDIREKILDAYRKKDYLTNTTNILKHLTKIEKNDFISNKILLEKHKLETLENYYEKEIKLNLAQHDSVVYYDKVIACLKFELLASITKEEINTLSEFKEYARKLK